MAKLTLTSFLTMDGVMQAPGGPNEDSSNGFQHGGWLVPLFDADMGAIMLDILSRANAFLLGRGTYDIYSAHWPKVTDPSDLVAARLNTQPKYVASTTRSDFAWDNTSHIVNVLTELESIQSRYDGELQVLGSHGLAQTLIEHSLIEEYRLFVCPVALGSGKRLFEALPLPAGFTLVGARSLHNGVIYNVYRPGVGFKTGSFGF
jgi:dihydrofolate reductase